MAARNRRKERLDRSIKVRSEGLYAISSWKEVTYLVLPRTVFILGLILVPLIVTDLYWLRVLSTVGVYVLLAISFDFLANSLGLVCIGGAFMIGVGGYISGTLNYYFGVPPALSIPIATLGGAFICTLVWSTCLSLRGIYFAMATFMFPFLAVSTILALNIFGGTNGLSPIDSLPNVWIELYVMAAVILGVVFGLRRLVGSDTGVIFVGIKENDQSVVASGINITRIKIYFLFVATLIGCFAGAWIVHLHGFVGASLFAMDFSILPIAATVLGGGGTIIGAALGAMILVPISELLRGMGQLRVVLYCAILIGFILFKPEGLMSWATQKYHQFERWREV